MSHELDINAFFALVRAGLFSHTDSTGNTEKISWAEVNWGEVYRLAGEQSVIGLVSAGLDWFKVHYSRFKVQQEWALQFIGQTLQIEQRNKAMNGFVADIVGKMHEADIYTLLVKGQGIAQCYERPLWRVSGDIDLFLSDTNYNKAKELLYPMSSSSKPERQFSKEWGMNIGVWYVELHGSQRTGLSSRVDKVIDNVQKDVFYGGKVRSVTFNSNDNHNDNFRTAGAVQVFLPAADEDVFFVFTHFIKHFYKEGGVSVRQLCDWCRLLWTYRDKLDLRLLESRIKRAGLMSEWLAFAAVAVDYLGMPIMAMPMYDSRLMANGSRFAKKAERIVEFILKGGEWKKWCDTMAVFRIFPWNTLRFAPGILLSVTWMKMKERFF